MNLNYFGQWQFNQGWPQMRCQVQPLHLLFWQNLSLELFKERNYSILDLEAFWWVHCQLVRFDPPSHKVAHDTHNTHVSNLLNDNRTWGCNFTRHFGTLFMSPNENESIQKNYSMNIGRTSSTSSIFIKDQTAM
jgi:hypothetical protein